MWYMDNSDYEDQRLPHHLFPPKMISMDRLMKKSGMFYRKMNMDDVGATKQRIDIIRKERGYKMEDECTLQEGVTQNFEAKIKEFYKEHIREQDEARLILDGHAYFDVQDVTDPSGNQWFRVLAEKGDFVIVPAGCVHRFTTDTNNFVKMRRYFCSEQPDMNVITGDDITNNPNRIKFLNEVTKKNTQNGNKADQVVIKTDLVVA